MQSIRQMAQFRQRVVKHALKNGNISSTARLFRVSRQSVHRWMLRWDGSLASLMDRSHKPRRHPSQHTQAEIALALKVQRHNKRLGLVCLWIHLKLNFGYTRSQTALYKLFRREGIFDAPKKRQRRKNKPYEAIQFPGERFQIDVKYVPKECLTGSLTGKKLYQYTAIDECTRWRHIAIFEEHSTHSSVEFLYQLLDKFPFQITCVQTDNGSEFTSRYTGAKEPSLFEAELAAFSIRHKLIAPATPRHNGKVERSHRSDQERFYNDNTFYNTKYLSEQMNRYRRQSNRQPLACHGWKSAQQMLENYQHVL
jgi:transposase